MFNFTEKQFIKTVKGLIAKNPDFIYIKNSAGGCSYTQENNRPACLFGQALTNLGLSINNLRKFNCQEYDIVSILTNNTNFSNKTIMWAIRLQELQDSNYRWGNLFHTIKFR